VALVAVLSPRLAILLVWLLTNQMAVAFGSFWVALVGFLVLPWTTLAWAVAYQPQRGVTGPGWVVVGVAVLVDLSSHLNAARARRVRRAPVAP
jgi:hypothetical protein